MAEPTSCCGGPGGYWAAGCGRRLRLIPRQVERIEAALQAGDRTTR
jgi:hypothetical protein